jgi:DNA-damage-inducible protein D
VVDIVAALIQQSDYQAARNYWNKLKDRLKKEGSQSVTNCHQLKMLAADGKQRRTDAVVGRTKRSCPATWLLIFFRARVIDGFESIDY